MAMSRSMNQYFLVTFNYWAFTLTDGALRMLVVLYFHQLGYGALEIALLFLFYELFGVVTNLVGGWLGARLGLNVTMNLGLALQIVALSMLAMPPSWLSIAWVMAAQALSGIAKDLNKMSAKSSVKGLVAAGQESTLFKWVAVLTGSKNALKGIGFFLGGLLLSLWGFQTAIIVMASSLVIVWLLSIARLDRQLGKAKNKPKFTDIFSKSDAINVLSAARFFLFGARDIWFVVALPVYMSSTLAWSHWQIGSFMASWIIGYGVVQASAPVLFNKTTLIKQANRQTATWAWLLALVPFVIAILLQLQWSANWVITLGLALFAVVFAVNSALHSYLIVSYADADHVSTDVGFYYMANAGGRLVGTLLSGWLFQQYGLLVCLIASAIMLCVAGSIAIKLPARG